MELKKGNMIKITLDDAHQDNCGEELLWLDYKNITKVVELGSKIYIDDGLISLQVKEIGELLMLIRQLYKTSYDPFRRHAMYEMPNKEGGVMLI